MLAMMRPRLQLSKRSFPFRCVCLLDSPSRYADHGKANALGTCSGISTRLHLTAYVPARKRLKTHGKAGRSKSLQMYQQLFKVRLLNSSKTIQCELWLVIQAAFSLHALDTSPMTLASAATSGLEGSSALVAIVCGQFGCVAPSAVHGNVSCSASNKHFQ